MKASDKFDGKILIVLFCLASPYSMQGVFVSWVFNHSGDLWFIILHPVLRLLRAWGDTPLLPLLNRQGWHGDINPPTDLQGAQTPRLFVCPEGPKRKEQIRTSVERFNMRHIKHDIFPNKKKTYLLKKYWQMFGGNCFFFWKIFRLKSCTYTYANKIIRAIFLIPWFPRILLGRVWPTNWHPGVSSEIAPTRPGRPWQEVILSATGGSSLVNVQRPCFPAVG